MMINKTLIAAFLIFAISSFACLAEQAYGDYNSTQKKVVYGPIDQQFYIDLKNRIAPTPPDSTFLVGKMIYEALPKEVAKDLYKTARIANKNKNSFAGAYEGNVDRSGLKFSLNPEASKHKWERQLQRYIAYEGIFKAVGFKWGMYNGQCPEFCSNLKKSGISSSTNQIETSFLIYMSFLANKDHSREHEIIEFFRARDGSKAKPE